MITAQLSDLTTLQAGYPFRHQIDNEPDGTVAVVQIRDIDYDNHRVKEESSLYRVNDILPKPHHLLIPGDVLFVPKGTNNNAVVLDHVTGPVVAASTFFVFRVTDREVLPDFLAWYLNSPRTQAYFRQVSRGTITPNLTREMVEELRVPVPSIEQQRAFVELERLALVERELADQIYEKRMKVLVGWIQRGPERISMAGGSC